MKIAIIGASGNIGAFIRDEALARGHQVTAIVRHPEKITARNPHLTVVKADILKSTIVNCPWGVDGALPSWERPTS